MRLAVLPLFAVVTFACSDPDPEALKKYTVPEIEARKRAEADQALRAHLQKGPLAPLGELNEFDEDAGEEPEKPIAAPVAPPPPDPQPKLDAAGLLKGWQTAEVGDFAELSCASFVNRFGNKVRRRLSLRMEVISKDEQSVVVRVRGAGTEEHDSDNPKTLRKHWTAQHKGAAELLVHRAPDEKLGPPIPARHLGKTEEKQLKVQKDWVKARCSRIQTTDSGEMVERCVASDVSKLYLTAGLLEEVTTLTSSGCKVINFGGVAPSKKQPEDLQATEYRTSERGEGKFRERVVAASAGVVRVELQRLRYLRKAEAGSLLFNGKHYAPATVDTRKMQLLDWALQTVMPEFPEQLPTD